MSAPACTEVVSKVTGYLDNITQVVSCTTERAIYYWNCNKPNCQDCQKNKDTGEIISSNEYVGKTRREYKKRISEHRDYVKREDKEQPAGEHFNKKGHSVHNLSGLVLEQVHSKDPFVLKAREHQLIQKFDSYRRGLNKEP